MAEQSKNDFPNYAPIRFEYVREKSEGRERWRLVNRIADPALMERIGLRAFRTPAIVRHPPQLLLKRLYRALTKNELDRGPVSELPTEEGRYSVVVIINPRAIAPNQ